MIYFDSDMSKSTNTVVYFDWKTVNKGNNKITEYIRLRKMSHTIYVTRIILRPLSALFGSQFMLPMETSVTFIGACANEIIRRNNTGFFLTKGKSEVMLELRNKSWKLECVGSFNMDWRILVCYPKPEARDKIY